MQTGIPVGPFTARKLSTLFRGKQDQGVVLLRGMLQRIQECTHLGIHVGYFGQVSAEILTRTDGICKMGWKVNFFRRVLGGIAHHPRHMRFDQCHHQAKRLAWVASDEFSHFIQAMWLSRRTHTVGIKSADGFEGKRGWWGDMHFTGQPNTISQRP